MLKTVATICVAVVGVLSFVALIETVSADGYQLSW